MSPYGVSLSRCSTRLLEYELNHQRPCWWIAINHCYCRNPTGQIDKQANDADDDDGESSEEGQSSLCIRNAVDYGFLLPKLALLPVSLYEPNEDSTKVSI